MAIVSSVIADDRTQADGRRAILEIHTDQTGKAWPRRYMAEAGDDLAAGLAGRAAELGAFIAQLEIDANLAEMGAG